MNLAKAISSRCGHLQSVIEQCNVLRRRSVPLDIERLHWKRSLSDPLGFYLDCFCFFHRRLPAEIKGHRKFFKRRRRGFGEDAFHTMWYLLFREFSPEKFLEIGVYRGQTLTLAALLARHFGFSCNGYGISPFTSSGDSVSRYVPMQDYYRDTLSNFDFFNLPHPTLLKAYSTDVQAHQLIASQQWDMAYIDGNHDYEVAKADWDGCAAAVRVGGLIILDDSALTSDYQPPRFASAGHPGPSRVADEIPQNLFHEILQVGHNRVFQKITEK